MNYIYLACAIYLFFAIGDLQQHNKKVVEYFPDDIDPDQNRARRDLTVNVFGFYLILIILVVASLVSIFNAYF